MVCSQAPSGGEECPLYNGHHTEQQLAEVEAVCQEIEINAKITEEAYEEVRSISHEMLPATLNELGLIAAIQQMLDRCFTASTINYDLEENIGSKRYNNNLEKVLKYGT